MFYETQEIDVKKLGLEEDKKTKTNKFRAICLLANTINSNGRYYPSETVELATKKLEKVISAKRAYGSSSHLGTEIHDVSHRILGLEFNKEKDELWMKGEILNTQKGKDLQVILKAGGSLGLSICASGKTEKKEIIVNGKKIEANVVGADLEIHKIDFSTAPSFPSARMDSKSMFESEDLSIPGMTEAEKVRHKMDLIDKHHGKGKVANENDAEVTIEEIRESYKEDFKKIFQEKQDSGEFDLEETFESWLEDHGLNDDELDRLIENDRQSFGFSELQLFGMAIDSGYTKNFETWQLLMKEDKKDKKLIRAYDDAKEAGYRGSFEDFQRIK